MKTKANLLLHLFLLSFLSACSLFDYDRIDFPAIESGIVVPINATSVRIEGEISGVQVGKVEQYGHFWNQTGEIPTLSEIQGCSSCTDLGVRRTSGAFESLATGLDIDAGYYFWAYMVHEEKGLLLSEPVSFLSGSISVKTLELALQDPFYLEVFGAISGVEVLTGNGQQLSQFGHVWDTLPFPGLDNHFDFSELGPLSADTVFSTFIPNSFGRKAVYYNSYALVDGFPHYGEERVLCLSGWEEELRSSYPSVRAAATGFTLDGKIYLGTGERIGRQYYRDFAVFDPLTGIWTEGDAPALPVAANARSGAVSFVLNGKAYIGTGEGVSGKLSDFWEWDPLHQTEWEPLAASFPGEPRSGAVAFVLNGTAYLFGGDGEEDSLGDLWRFDGQEWEQLSFDQGPEGREGAVVFAIGERAYLGGGNAGSAAFSDFWSFDGISWAQEDFLPDGARSGAVAFTLGGYGYVASGRRGLDPVAGDMFAFDPDAPPGFSWHYAGSLPEPLTFREKAVGLALDNHGYILTGQSSIDRVQYFLDTWNYFDPCIE